MVGNELGPFRVEKSGQNMVEIVAKMSPKSVSKCEFGVHCWKLDFDENTSKMNGSGT